MSQPPMAVQKLTTGLERALEVGARVMINFAPDQERPAQSCLRGWAVGDYVLLDEPADNPGTVEFKQGATWRLKYVANGNVCMAETMYLERSSPSTGSVYVSFPQEITIHALRHHHRVPTDLPAQVGKFEQEDTPPDTLHDTTICDLSLSGCAVLVPEALPTGAQLSLLFASTPGEVPIHFTGRVRRCTESAGRYMVGVEFDELGTEQRPAVVRLLGTAALRQDILQDNDSDTA